MMAIVTGFVKEPILDKRPITVLVDRIVAPMT